MFAYITIEELLAAYAQGYEYPCDGDSQVCYLDSI